MNETTVSSCSKLNIFSKAFQKAGQLFYYHNPAETSFATVEEVPNYFRNVWPSFILFIFLENLILCIQKKTTLRLNDSITSISHGIIQECGRLVFRGSESAVYIYIYNNWRVLDLSWDSASTWCITFIGVDFCYYWVHRASHEIHLFWAQHQVHHSSEEFNITVGLRQSLLQGWCSFIFYLPMALFIPPSHFVAHQQFNLLYQVWIHTKTIKTLGILEYVLNTPQHHRVHHGCNLYCLDKNYGGVFIIWDRIFNTFADEKEKEEIIYGLVHHEPSFNPFYLQVFYNQHVIEKFKTMKGFKNKLYSLIKGPSWMPGSPWTGFEKDKLDIKTRLVYDVKVSFWHNIYVSIHFIAILIGFENFVITCMAKNALVVFIFAAYTIISLTSIGMIIDNHPQAIFVKMTRCLLNLLFTFQYKNFADYTNFSGLTKTFFGVSVLFWSLQFLKSSQLRNEV